MTLASAQKLVALIIPVLRLSQIKTLAWAVLGCLRNPSGLLTEIARGCVGRVGLKHKVKRLGRWLGNKLVHVEELAPCLLQWLLARQGPLFRPIIAMDWTKEHGQCVLSLSLIWQRRALPFYWYAVAEGKLSRSQNQIESTAISLLKMWMRGRPFILLADRGFHRAAFIRALLEKYRIDFVIRVIKSTHVVVKGYRGSLEKLEVEVGKTRDFREALYGDNARIPVRLVVKRVRCRRGKDPEESVWYLVTSIRDESKHRIVGYYQQRMGIEASYRDWKTALGWRRQIYIKDSERLSRYLLVLTVAMFFAVYLAESLRGQRRRYLVALPLSWRSRQSASLVQLGIWLIQQMCDRECSIHPKKLFQFGRL